MKAIVLKPFYDKGLNVLYHENETIEITEEKFNEYVAAGHFLTTGGTGGSSSGGGGVTSYNDLTDKPFGEEMTISNTLEWDGTESDINVGGLAYYVCGSVPEYSAFIGGTFELAVGETTQSDVITEDTISHMGEAYTIGGAAFVASQDNYVIEESGMVFPKKGIYFMKQSPEVYLKSITAPTEIFEVVDIKPLDEKYLPETVATKSYVDEVIGGIENGTY